MVLLLWGRGSQDTMHMNPPPMKGHKAVAQFLSSEGWYRWKCRLLHTSREATSGQQQCIQFKPGAGESPALSQESKSHPTECDHMQPALWHQERGLSPTQTSYTPSDFYSRIWAPINFRTPLGSFKQERLHIRTCIYVFLWIWQTYHRAAVRMGWSAPQPDVYQGGLGPLMAADCLAAWALWKSLTSWGVRKYCSISLSEMFSSPVTVEIGGVGQTRFGGFNMQGGRRRAGLADRFLSGKSRELFPTSSFPCPCPCPIPCNSFWASTSAVPSRKALRINVWRCWSRSPMYFTTDLLSSFRTCNQASCSAIRSSTASNSCRREEAG